MSAHRPLQSTMPRRLQCQDSYPVLTITMYSLSRCVHATSNSSSSAARYVLTVWFQLKPSTGFIRYEITTNVKHVLPAVLLEKYERKVHRRELFNPPVLMSAVRMLRYLRIGVRKRQKGKIISRFLRLGVRQRHPQPNQRNETSLLIQERQCIY